MQRCTVDETYHDLVHVPSGFLVAIREVPLFLVASPVFLGKLVNLCGGHDASIELVEIFVPFPARRRESFENRRGGLRDGSGC